MSKKKQDEVPFEQAIEKENGEVVIVNDPSHLKPQAEPKGHPPRPEAVDKDHLKPQEEVKDDNVRVKAKHPSHLKPQE